MLPLIVALILYVLVFGFLVSWLADERGRDPVRWFILGTLIGPLALLAVGFSPRLIGMRFKACLECQEAVAVGATKCPFCATDLIQAEAEERQLT
jgi:MFS family permease